MAESEGRFLNRNTKTVDRSTFDEDSRKKLLVIYDIDGTICENGKCAEQEMYDFLQELRKKASLALIGGSRLERIQDNMGEDVLERFDYVFAENGLVAHKGSQLLGKQEFKHKFTNAQINEMLNWVLIYLGNLELPVKRGLFVDFRTGLINISPAGRMIFGEDRDQWVAFDEANGVRKAMVAAMKERFAHMDLDYVIGGQLGFDIFPKGWDKSFCMNYIALEGFSEIHFFGDRTFPGGNDYTMYTHPKVKGHAINSPQETYQISKTLWFTDDAGAGSSTTAAA